jgi:hypothetical protein
MSRTRSATAGIAAALVTACCAICAPSYSQPGGPATTFEQSCLEAQNDARMGALKNLQDKVFGLPVAENKTVKDVIESTDLPKTGLIKSLLQGVVEIKPMLVYGNGECVVRAALGGEVLRANLKRILEQNYKKEGGEFAKLTFDGVGGEGLKAEAVGTIVLPNGSNASVSECVEGWRQDAAGQPISARKRIETEHAAYLDGLAKVKKDVENLKIDSDLTVSALMASNPLVKETVEKFFSKLLPNQKLYWPKGIAEVRFMAPYETLWTALEQANQNPADPKQRLAAAVLTTARDRTRTQGVAPSGWSQVDGKPVNPAEMVETTVSLDLNAMSEPPLPEPEQAK